jgi:hypothetical protein
MNIYEHLLFNYQNRQNIYGNSSQYKGRGSFVIHRQFETIPNKNLLLKIVSFERTMK